MVIPSPPCQDIFHALRHFFTSKAEMHEGAANPTPTYTSLLAICPLIFSATANALSAEASTQV